MAFPKGTLLALASHFLQQWHNYFICLLHASRVLTPGYDLLLLDSPGVQARPDTNKCKWFCSCVSV